MGCLRRGKWILLALIAVLAITGCGRFSPSADKKPEESKKELRQGGQLVYGSLQEPSMLNPLLSDLLSVSEVSSLLFNGLLYANDKGEWMPDLALDVPSVQNGGVSRDGLTVTYRLRPGVTWHDGVAFTSQDVKFTWQLIMKPKANVISREGYDKITSIDTPDATTVVVRFREFYAPYLTLFSVILPKHILENVPDINKAAFNRSPIGTGPFKLKEWRMAEAIILEANPQFFRGKPVLDSIEYKVVPEMNLLLTQLKAGEIDIASNLDLSQLDQARSLDNVNVVTTPNSIWEHVDFNLDKPLFQEVQVRQAIVAGVDRQAIVATVLKNAAVPAAGDQPPVSWAYNPAVTASGRDVNAARGLLNQAGWVVGPDGIYAKNGVRLSFSLAYPQNDKTREAVAQLLVQQLKEVGIEARPLAVEKETFFNDTLKNRRFDMALYAWAAGSDPDNSDLWNSRHIPGWNNGYAGRNYPGWRNPEVDGLTEQAVRTPDLETRKQAYFRIQEIINQEYPVLPLYFHTQLAAMKKNIANYKPGPAGALLNAWQWGFR